jgi:hypothetical protein
MSIADDFAAIAKRWKEIHDKPSTRTSTGEAAPVPASTVTGSGGFITPDGKPYNAIPENYIG